MMAAGASLGYCSQALVVGLGVIAGGALASMFA